MGKAVNNHFVFVTRLRAALTRFRDMHPEVTALQIEFFLAIVANPGITQRSLYNLLGTNDSVSSRTLAILSEYGSRGTPGLELVRLEVNPEDRRERLCYITKKGGRLMTDVERQLME